MGEGKISVNGIAIKELAEILNDTGLTEIEYEDQGCRIRVAKAPASVVMSVPPSNTSFAHPISVTESSPVSPGAKEKEAASQNTQTGHIIRSPMVGTAYISPEPGAPPYVKVGDHIQAGQTLLIIEAMKVMNPIKSNHSGIVKEIIAKDGSPVEFDEPLIVVE